MSPPPNREFLGAIAATGTTRLGVWAPAAQRVKVEFADGDCMSLPLSRAADGYFSRPSGSTPRNRSSIAAVARGAFRRNAVLLVATPRLIVPEVSA